MAESSNIISTTMDNSNGLLRTYIVLFLSLLAIAIILAYVDLNSVWEKILSAHYLFLFYAICSIAIYQFFRVLRLQSILCDHNSRTKLFLALNIQGVANSILPAGLGELVLAWIIRKLLGNAIGSSLAAIMVARLFDMAVLSLSAVIILSFATMQFPSFILWSALILFGTSLAVACLLIFFSVKKFNWFKWHVKLKCVRKLRWNFYRGIRTLRYLQNYKIIFSIFLLTLLIWSTFLIVYIFIIYAFNLNLSLTEILIIYILSYPVQLIPVKTIANIGIFEGVWVIILTALGRDEKEALVTAVTAHFGILVTIILSATIVTLTINIVIFIQNSIRKH